MDFKRNKTFILILCVMLCTVFLGGCGRSLVITTGFGNGEVFRLGKTRGRIAEMRVYMLDLQKESEALYGEAIWESADSGKMQQAVKDQALSQLTRVKALGQLAISRNVMLTNLEEDLAVEAEQKYFAGLSEEEKKYLDLNEKELLSIMKEYALAARMWYSLGDSAEETYEEYYGKTQCDLNTRYWKKVSLKKVEGNPSAPGFAQCYRESFAEVEYPANFENSADGSTGSESEIPEESAENEEAEEPEDSAEEEKVEEKADSVEEEKAEEAEDSAEEEKAE